MKKPKSKSYDITSAKYIIMNELEYNLRDNIYMHRDCLYKVSSVEEDRYGNYAIMSIRVRFISLDGIHSIQNYIVITDNSIENCLVPEDIAQKSLKKLLKEEDYQLVSDELVNSEAFRTLYL